MSENSPLSRRCHDWVVRKRVQRRPFGPSETCGSPDPKGSPIQERAHDTADNPAFGSLSGAGRQVLLELVSQLGDGESLQPHPARTGQRGEKDSVSAEDHVFDPRNPGDLKGNTGLEGAYMPGMDAQRLSRRQVLDYQFSRQLDPQAPCPVTFCSRNPSPPKTPAPRDC